MEIEEIVKTEKKKITKDSHDTKYTCLQRIYIINSLIVLSYWA